MMLFTISVMILLCKSIEMVIVRIDDGLLEGEILEAVTGDKTYYSFKGIPYAAPPLGDLRFMAPQPLTPWKGIRSAKQHGSICVQNPNMVYEDSVGDEDCLFLNVYTPNIAPNCTLPVMVFIFGGAFGFGSGNTDIYGPDFLVRDDVVIVTMNYRVGLLGFLNLGIKEVPGNAGMKDQVAALIWVKKNIKEFGGDPDNVTLFGHSSGAACVTLHLFSPMSKGLFKRAIVLSGTMLNDAFRPFEEEKRGFVAAKKMGLNSANGTEVFKFLQTMPAEKLRAHTPNILLSESGMYAVGSLSYFKAVVEKDFGDKHFLTVDPLRQLESGDFKCVDLVTGHTNKEGLDNVIMLQSNMFEYFNEYPELLVPLKIAHVSSPEKVLELAQIINQYYFGDDLIDLSTLDQLVEFYSYYKYVYDVNRFLEAWAHRCDNTYSFEFTGYTEMNYYGKKGAAYNITGTSHIDEILYLFHAKMFNSLPSKNSKALKIVENFCTLLTNFAKFSNPTPDNSLGVIWPRYKNDRRNIIIDEHLSNGVTTFSGQLGFWKRVLEIGGIKY